jgi:hypothetical protein
MVPVLHVEVVVLDERVHRAREFAHLGERVAVLVIEEVAVLAKDALTLAANLLERTRDVLAGAQLLDVAAHRVEGEPEVVHPGPVFM